MVGAGNKESAGELGGGVLEQEVYSVLCSAGIDRARLRADVVVSGSIYNWGYELSGGDTYPSGGRN